MEIIKVEGIDLQEVNLIDSGNKYKDTSKLAGKTYSRFSYEGKVFACQEGPGLFPEAFKKGDVKRLKLSLSKIAVIDENGEPVVPAETRDALSFASFVTITQWKAYQVDRLSDAKIDGQINALANFTTSSLTEDQLKSFIAEA